MKMMMMMMMMIMVIMKIIIMVIMMMMTQTIHGWIFSHSAQVTRAILDCTKESS